MSNQVSLATTRLAHGQLLSLVLLCLSLPFSGSARALPPGTNLEVRLLSSTGSRLSHRGDAVRAMVIAPVLQDGTVQIPQGAILSGSVARVNRLGFGLKHCTAAIEFSFTHLELPEQEPLAMTAKVLEVETARERVNGKGVIGGIHPAANLSSGVSLFISAILMDPNISVPVLGIKLLLARSPDPEIYLPAGTEMIVQTTAPLDTPTHFSNHDFGTLSSEDENAARDLLAHVPQQSESKPNRPSDLSNVLILGKRGQIDRAFHAAGWTGANGHNALALYRMFHCVVQRAGYSMAPMTRLRLNGVPQQADFQKSLDTFAKRHHIRLWKQEGSNAWLSAASEDVSFTMDKMLVNHASDRNIDNERAKVVNDLALTGCVDSAGVLSRNDLRVESTGTRTIVTDGKIAVVRLNNCEHAANPITPEPHPVPSKMARIALALVGDIERSNPLSLGMNALNMAMNHRNTKEQTFAKNQGKSKVLAQQALLSNSWKRQSLVDRSLAVAGDFSGSVSGSR